GSNRFEVRDGMIRAVYGHSTKLESPPAVVEPPDFLFHGTAENLVPVIRAKGLLRMRRRFVHLSSDLDWVRGFLATKSHWAVIRICALDAHNNGCSFRRANGHVWLGDSVSPEFLQLISSNRD